MWLTHPEKHKAPHKHDILYGVRLIREPTVLALEILERDGLFFRHVLEIAAHERLVRIDLHVCRPYGPRHGETDKVRELTNIIYVIINA